MVSEPVCVCVSICSCTIYVHHSKTNPTSPRKIDVFVRRQASSDDEVSVQHERGERGQGEVNGCRVGGSELRRESVTEIMGNGAWNVAAVCCRLSSWTTGERAICFWRSTFQFPVKSLFGLLNSFLVWCAPSKSVSVFFSLSFSWTSSTMGTIYNEHKDADGFLYIAYSGENTFGSA